MDRLERMSARVAFFVLADEEEPVFDAMFSILRERAKDFKEGLEDKAKVSLERSLKSDLKDHGVEVVSVEISLGKYRGSRFVTSAKVSVRASEAKARSLVKVLQRYHPKYALKSYEEETDIAVYNIR